jgi:hypothetical protein
MPLSHSTMRFGAPAASPTSIACSSVLMRAGKAWESCSLIMPAAWRLKQAHKETPAWNADAIRFYERERGIGEIKMRFSKSLSAQ